MTKFITVHVPYEYEAILPRISSRLPLKTCKKFDWERLSELNIAVDKIVYYDDEGIGLVTDEFIRTKENAREIWELLK